jgi:hypothetical protein
MPMSVGNAFHAVLARRELRIEALALAPSSLYPPRRSRRDLNERKAIATAMCRTATVVTEPYGGGVSYGKPPAATAHVPSSRPTPFPQGQRRTRPDALVAVLPLQIPFRACDTHRAIPESCVAHLPVVMAWVKSGTKGGRSAY